MDGSPESRYTVVPGPEGPEIACANTPNVRLRVRRGTALTARDVKRQPRQSIFLDGAFAGPPFHDHGARRYSLDHHAGCLRPVTLSTCEQAATMLVLGMPLKEGDWTVLLNEPDLDAVLAAWVLLNHLDLLRPGGRLLQDAMPLLRVEGVIDVHGLGKEVLAGLPDDLLALQLNRIDALMEPVRALKADGAWNDADLVEFTARQLALVDRLVMPGEELARLREFQEAGRAALRGHRTAVLCRSRHGIYEVEEHLRQRYGKTLGLVVLDAGDGRFTLRRTDAFLDADLKPLYRLLNRRDPLARPRQGDGWGGAGDIGGSPRSGGSGLTGDQVMDAVRRVYGERPHWWQRAWRWAFGGR